MLVCCYDIDILAGRLVVHQTGHVAALDGQVAVFQLAVVHLGGVGDAAHLAVR